MPDNAMDCTRMLEMNPVAIQCPFLCFCGFIEFGDSGEGSCLAGITYSEWRMGD